MDNTKSDVLSPSFRFRSALLKYLPKRLQKRASEIERANRIYIVPSAIGLYFSFIGFILFLIAVSYGHNLAYFATFLFLGFVGLSAIIANENVGALQIEWFEQTMRFREHSSGPHKIVIRNNSKRTRYDVAIEITGVTIGYIDEIKSLEAIEVEIDLARLKLQRGLYNVKRLVFSTRFPFGLFYAWTWRPVEIDFIVAPKPKQIHVPLIARTGLFQGQGGISFGQGVDDFYEVRDHRPGESMARIDRRRSMRLDRPQIREFRDEAAKVHILDLRQGKTEEVLAGALHWLDHLDEFSYCGFILPHGNETNIDNTVPHRVALFDEIASFDKVVQVLA